MRGTELLTALLPRRVPRHRHQRRVQGGPARRRGGRSPVYGARDFFPKPFEAERPAGRPRAEVWAPHSSAPPPPASPQAQEEEDIFQPMELPPETRCHQPRARPRPSEAHGVTTPSAMARTMEDVVILAPRAPLPGRPLSPADAPAAEVEPAARPPRAWRHDPALLDRPAEPVSDSRFGSKASAHRKPPGSRPPPDRPSGRAAEAAPTPASESRRFSCPSVSARRWAKRWLHRRPRPRPRGTPAPAGVVARGRDQEGTVPRLLTAYYEARHHGKPKLKQGQVLEGRLLRAGQPITPRPTSPRALRPLLRAPGPLPAANLEAVAAPRRSRAPRTGDALSRRACGSPRSAGRSSRSR